MKSTHKRTDRQTNRQTGGQTRLFRQNNLKLKSSVSYGFVGWPKTHTHTKAYLFNILDILEALEQRNLFHLVTGAVGWLKSGGVVNAR